MMFLTKLFALACLMVAIEAKTYKLKTKIVVSKTALSNRFPKKDGTQVDGKKLYNTKAVADGKIDQIVSKAVRTFNSKRAPPLRIKLENEEDVAYEGTRTFQSTNFQDDTAWAKGEFPEYHLVILLGAKPKFNKKMDTVEYYSNVLATDGFVCENNDEDSTAVVLVEYARSVRNTANVLARGLAVAVLRARNLIKTCEHLDEGEDPAECNKFIHCKGEEFENVASATSFNIGKLINLAGYGDSDYWPTCTRSLMDEHLQEQATCFALKDVDKSKDDDKPLNGGPTPP